MKKLTKIIILLAAIINFPACTTANKNSTTSKKVFTCEDLNTCIDQPISIGEVDDVTIANNQIVNEYSEAYKLVNPITVQLQSFLVSNNSYTAITFNSGFIFKQVENTYYILTTDRQYEDSNYYTEIVFNDGVRYQATFYASFFNSNFQVAIFTFQSEVSYPIIDIDFDYEAKIGETILVMGTPSLTSSLVNTMTKGIISGLDRQIAWTSVDGQTINATGFQFDAPVNNGVEGGPVFTKEGKVIGMVSSKIYNSVGTQIESIGIANCLKDIKPIVNSLLTNKKFTPPSLGVSILDLYNLTILNKQYLKIYPIELGLKIIEENTAGGLEFPSEINNGLYISQIVAGKAFDLANVMAGDIILSVNDIEILNFVTFTNYLYAKFAGEIISVKTYLNPTGYLVTLQ